jgi:hypothetical protein
MASPIKETRTLYGKEAADFARQLTENVSRPVPPEEYERAMEVYRRMQERHGEWL